MKKATISNVDMRYISLNKIVSLNPNRFELKPFIELMDSYREYIKSCMKFGSEPKYFEVWLETEI